MGLDGGRHGGDGESGILSAQVVLGRLTRMGTDSLQ